MRGTNPDKKASIGTKTIFLTYVQSTNTTDGGHKSSFIQIVQGFHSSSPNSHWNLLDCLGTRRRQLENRHRAIRGVSRRPGMEITTRKYGKDGTLCRRICSPPPPPQPAPSSRLLPPPGNTNQYIKCFHKGSLKASAQS